MNKPIAPPATVRIGLAGQPNTGKSTLFNRLTGARQHVGNWPGKTVEQKSGSFSYDGQKYTLVDLPGTYSLSANSVEELITRDQIVSEDTDVLIVLIDASQIHRSMYLLSEIAGIDIPVIAVCTMVDVALKQGITVNVEKMEKRLGIPVVAINATRNEGIDHLKEKIGSAGIQGNRLSDLELSKEYEKILGHSFSQIRSLLPEKKFGKYGNVWLASRLMERDTQITNLVREKTNEEQQTRLDSVMAESNQGALDIANARYAWIKNVLTEAIDRQNRDRPFQLCRFDRWITHWFFGKIISTLMILAGFALSFILVIPFMKILNMIIFPVISSLLKKGLIQAEAPAWMMSFTIKALIPGVNITLTMILFIVAVIFVFSLMEDIGLTARIAFVFDGVMERLGLNGKSVFPFISSLGCNIAGVVGSRVIDSSEQRKVTIATSLVMPCLGNWGVISLVSAVFFGGKAVWVVMSLFAVTILHALFTSWVFGGRLNRKKRRPGLIMELPPYHKPSWKTIFQFVWGKLKNVARKAGKAIFLAIVAVWALTYTGSGDITQSALYAFGKLLEPYSMLIGLDWRLLLSLLISTFAKEAAIGAITIFFGLGQLGTGGILSSLGFHDTGELAKVIGMSISKASSLAFIFAFYFNVPCAGTIAAVHSETHSVRFTCAVAAYYIAGALFIAGIAYRIGLALF